ncbi:MAG: carbon storage regulator [Planctomycetes bacterium]|nr:carbon storage regulator [Planctomycetota bacterium]
MLVLTRRLEESLIIGDGITVKVVKTDKTQVKLGIDAPEDVTINREDVPLFTSGVIKHIKE